MKTSMIMSAWIAKNTKQLIEIKISVNTQDVTKQHNILQEMVDVTNVNHMKHHSIRHQGKLGKSCPNHSNARDQNAQKEIRCCQMESANDVVNMRWSLLMA